MSRERLMAQQRARAEAAAARKRAEALKKKKKEAEAKKKQTRSQKGGTSRKAAVVKSATSGLRKVAATAIDNARGTSIKPDVKAPKSQAGSKVKVKKPEVGKIKTQTTKPKTTTKASDKAVKGGYTISAKNRLKRNKDGSLYQGNTPGTPKPKEEKGPKRSSRRGAAARAKSRQTSSIPIGREKAIKVGNKKVIMVWNGSEYVQKK